MFGRVVRSGNLDKADCTDISGKVGNLSRVDKTELVDTCTDSSDTHSHIHKPVEPAFVFL